MEAESRSIEMSGSEPVVEDCAIATRAKAQKNSCLVRQDLSCDVRLTIYIKVSVAKKGKDSQDDKYLLNSDSREVGSGEQSVDRG